MPLTGSVGEYPATPNIERGEVNEVYNFVYSTDRFSVGFAPMVKSRDMARNWSQIFEIVCSTGDFHAQNEVVYFVYIRNSFLSRRLETFFNAARKDVEKVKLWRTGAWLSVEGYSVELYIVARARDPQNFDKSPPCWMPKIFDEWSILPKQVDCFFSEMYEAAVIDGEVNVLVTS